MWLTYTLLSILTIIIILIIVSYIQAKKSSVAIEAEEFKLNMRKGQLVDVRTSQEFKAGHISGARNISVQTISREYSKLRKDQPIYLYCQSGKRSSRAAIYLKAKGYTDIYELKNGLNGWDGPLKK